MKQFAKMDDVSITIGDFSLFVGDNNSGKTLMMELLYGIIELISMWEPDITCAKITEMDGVVYIKFADDWIAETERNINDYLRNNQAIFLQTCFSTPMSAKEISVHLDYLKTVFYIGTIAETVYLEKEYADGNRENVPCNVSGTADVMMLQLAQCVLRDMLGLPAKKKQLFLPAARAGLQMLYKSFFANMSGPSGFTMPVYDYLKFLQTYVPRTHFTQNEEELIEFVGKELLGGKIEYQNDSFLYRDKHCFIPLNMASSMIHELSSFDSVLKSESNFGYLYYDEAENSIHPIKQGQLAKALIRYCNLDHKILVSTHSDTLAGKINNLMLVSRMKNVIRKNKTLEQLGWSVRDLLQPEKIVNIYEFKQNEKGRVMIEELEFFNYPEIGYDFGRFNENIDMLYDESKCITGWTTDEGETTENGNDIC